MTLEIITPAQSWEFQDITALDVPAENGRLTVLQNHEAFVCSLKKGMIHMEETDAGRKTSWDIGPGTLSVKKNRLTLITRQAKPE